MAGKEVRSRALLRLSEEERARLEGFVGKGKRAALLLTRARILLKADVSEAGDGWSDSRIAEALDTSVGTVERTRRQLVEEGFDAVLTRKFNPQFRPAADLRRRSGSQADRSRAAGLPARAAPSGPCVF